MADISIQFHAMPEELLQFVKECLRDFNIHVVAMRFFPFEATEVSADRLEEIFSTSSAFRELAFTVERPVLPVKSSMHFHDQNPSNLGLEIQRPTEKGLRQTWLACRTGDARALSIWKKIAKRLKEMTTTGVVAVNPDTGACASSSSFRFTSGAKALELAGVPMLPAAGGNVLRFGEAGK